MGKQSLSFLRTFQKSFYDHDYTIRLNKKEKRAALKSVLTSKVQENKFIVVDELKFDEIKTKTMKNVLANLKADKALVILNDNDQNVVLSARNIEGVQTALTNTINVFDLLKQTPGSLM